MHFLAILAILLATFFSALLSSNGLSNGLSNLTMYFDIVSLLLILVLTIPIMLSAGLLKDFNRAFPLVIGKKKETTLHEINRSIIAVGLAMKTLVAGGVFLFLCAVIQILMSLDDPSYLGPNCAVAIITMVYSMILVLLLLPLKARLEILKQEYMQQEE